MSEPFIGEIRLFAGNFAPNGWMTCAGQLLAISDLEPLFALIGTTYGGDGQSTFALPDLQGRVPMHFTSGFVQGQKSGVETVTLTTGQLPTHRHTLQASTQVGSSAKPTNRVFAQGPAGAVQMYTQDNTVVPTATPVAPVGGNQPHENRQPLMVVTFIISLFGVFPSPG